MKKEKLTKRNLMLLKNTQELKLIELYTYGVDYFKRLILFVDRGEIVDADYEDVIPTDDEKKLKIPTSYLRDSENVVRIGYLDEIIKDEELLGLCNQWMEEEIGCIIQYEDGNLYFIDFQEMHEEDPGFVG